jgi:hypothetical protein
MKKITQLKFVLILTLSLFSFTMNFAQSSTDEKKITQQIETFFEGLNAKDTIQLKSTMIGKVGLKSVLIKNGEKQLVTEEMSAFINQIGNLPNDLIIEEKVQNMKVSIRFPLAEVFTDYIFYINNEKSHSGINLFTLAFMDSEWKIINIVDTRQ